MGKFLLGIKSFRERKKMNVITFAEELNVSDTTYNNWEKGKGKPPFDIVKKLFEMGATVEELFGVEYESNMLQYSKKYQKLQVRVAQLEKIMAGSGSEIEREREFSEEYASMMRAKYKMHRLDKKIEQTSDEAEKAQLSKEYKKAVESYDISHKRMQDLQMQVLEEDMKTGNYSEASQIRAMINSKASNSYENEFPELSSFDIGLW